MLTRSDAQDFADSLGEFNEQAAELNSALWPCTFTLSTDPASPKAEIAAYGRPPSRARVMDEMRGGYVLRTIRAFALLPSEIPAGATVGLGTEFTVVADERNPDNVGTIWRCFEFNDSDAGSQVRAVCFRLDNPA